MYMNEPKKLIFANQLRAVAAAFVILAHFVGVYWGNPSNLISLVTHSPAPVGSPPEFVVLVSNQNYNLGPIGVGIFFLISGFVISISLQSRPIFPFILARILRIYPTYIAALAIEIAAIKISSLYWAQNLDLDLHSLMMNALLIHGAFGIPSFDLVNWTLAIEVKFYILMALLAAVIRKGDATALTAIALFLLLVAMSAISGTLSASIENWFVLVARTDSPFLIFMLIGVLFSFRLRGLLSRTQLALGCLAFLDIFAACWHVSAYAPLLQAIAINYVYALGIFSVCFAVRSQARQFWVLDRLADLSYPLYLIHSLVGYVVLRMLMVGYGVSYGLALISATLAACLIAAVLHHIIELPSIAIGRMVGARRHVQAKASPWNNDDSVVELSIAQSRAA
jgi:peptidoglycan/LPS O-acetylase OafA/YrhL